MTNERCEVCRAPMHRYGFPTDGQHKPTAIACANVIIGDIDTMLSLGGGPIEREARANIHNRVGIAITFLAEALNTARHENARLLRAAKPKRVKA